MNNTLSRKAGRMGLPPAQQAFAPGNFEVDSETEMATWFCAGMQRAEIRQQAEAVMQGPTGSFLVRDTQSHPGSFGLTVKVADKQLKNFLLTRVSHPQGINGMGYQLGTKAYATLSDFVQQAAAAPHPDVGVRLHAQAQGPSMNSTAIMPASPGGGILKHGEWPRPRPRPHPHLMRHRRGRRAQE